jgi:cell division protein YceG involved in septum cleavage
MDAATHPASGTWLYFVAEPDKVHTYFTASAQAFEHYKATHGYG